MKWDGTKQLGLLWSWELASSKVMNQLECTCFWISRHLSHGASLLRFLLEGRGQEHSPRVKRRLPRSLCIHASHCYHSWSHCHLQCVFFFSSKLKIFNEMFTSHPFGETKLFILSLNNTAAWVFKISSFQCEYSTAALMSHHRRVAAP